MKLLKLSALAAIVLAALPATAFAQDDSVEIDVGVGLFSDYRFRGISLSGEDPEVTAEIYVTHESGFYAGAWASNVDLGGGADDLEVDLDIGYGADFGGLSFSAGGLYYMYPGNSSLNYFELYSSVGTQVGPGTFEVGVAYAPSQDPLGNTDNTYVYISTDVPVGETGISFHGTFGYEDGAFADSKKDWMAGMSYAIGDSAAISLDYVDTKHSLTPLGDATLLVSITAGF